MLKSPYGNDPSRWSRVTKKLIASHPLTTDIIREAALKAWDDVWKTRVGSGALAIDLTCLVVPATIVGYFFEVLLARELAHRFPKLWRGGQGGDEKDLVYIPDHRFSVEIKTSGQRGLRIYGNRSYNQEWQNLQAAK